MEKAELSKIVKKVSINWNAATTGPPFQERASLWWKFLSDLSEEDVDAAIDQIIIIDQERMPRVGQVRRLAIDLRLGDAIPDPASAWSQLRSAVTGSEAGVSFEKPHDLVGQTMKTFPNNGASLRTNSDRELFLQAYSKVVGAEERKRYLGVEQNS